MNDLASELPNDIRTGASQSAFAETMHPHPHSQSTTPPDTSSSAFLSISKAYVALPEDKRAAFRARLKASGIDASRLPVVPFPEADRRFALSHAQERLWFLWRLDPSSDAYNVTGAVRLRGRLDIAGLRAALDSVVDRHQSLRQRFAEVDGVAYQITGPREYGWETRSLSASAASSASIHAEALLPIADAPPSGGADNADNNRQQAAALDALLKACSALPFDLRRGPLLRVTLIELGANDHILHIALHHIVADGLSIEVFVAAVAEAYRNIHAAIGTLSSASQPLAMRSEGTEAATANVTPTAEASLQYGDYAQWQREWFDEDTLTRQLDYWRARLGDQHPVLEWPPVHPEPTVRKTNRNENDANDANDANDNTSRHTDGPQRGNPASGTKRTLKRGAGARIARLLPSSLQATLAHVSLAADATPFMTLLAVYNVLLSRYCAQTDIRVGVPVAGRDRPEVADMIGFFVNTLVIRTELDGVDTFASLLAQVRDRVCEAQAHADLPFSKLVDALQPARSFGHTPLFQAMFNYLGADRRMVSLPELNVSNYEIDTQTARFDLVLEARERGHGLEVAFTYAEDRFERRMIEQMLDHYVMLLEQIAAEVDRPLGSLRLTQDDPSVPPERRYVPVSMRFAQRAVHHADDLAVHCEGTRTTYVALDAWARRVAAALAQAGVCVDERVGICLTRSVGMVAALLGTLRSPGAFVPLDPAYPGERLTTMMNDARVRVVLTDALTRAQCATLLDGRLLIDIDTLATASDDIGASDVDGEVDRVHPLPEQLAYVIYTSGSTGKPKGVAISHRAFATHLDDFIEAHRISADDVVLQSSTINFDVALHELFPALLCGGTVEMRGAEPWDIETTSRHLIEARVTFSRLPTAYWQQWLQSPPAPNALSALRQITVGGEGLPGDALAQWRRGPLRHIQLANLYGPTETTVACMYRATTAEDTAQAIVSIGEPYRSRTARVLDRLGNDVPVGALGELCIGGHTLARGYLDRPSLTAERFVPDSSGASVTPGARLYRTGDLCRRRADGAIDFLGRLDQQIKLRGFRIEPGEIEAALRRQPGVANAVVVLANDLGAPRLVAYVVAASDQTRRRARPPAADLDPSTPGGRAEATPFSGVLDTAVLQRNLAQALPAHMVPSTIAVLDSMPLMQNGKVDRAALPAVAATARCERLAPRNAAERVLLALWTSILGRDDLSVDDDFFAVGGDSILSLQLIARARAQGWLLTPRQVFEHPTIERLALTMCALEASEAIQEVSDALPLTPIQQWFFSRYPDGEPHWNQSVLLAVDGSLDLNALERALNAVVARHDALRLRFFRHDVLGEWQQQLREDVPQDLLSVKTLQDAGVQWTAALHEEGQHAQRALDLGAGRLLKAVYFRIPDDVDASERGRLLLVIHHLAVDGVSWRVLLTDLQAEYGAYRTTGQEATPSLNGRTPWTAWVVAQREAVNTASMRKALRDWQSAMQGAQSGLAATYGTVASSRVHEWRLDAAATAALRDAAPRAYRLGIDELLLTALSRAVVRHFGGHGALFALEGHGRSVAAAASLDLSRTVGWFTTRYPVWLATTTRDTSNVNVAQTAADAEDAHALVATKECLRALPDGGASWGWLQAYGETASRAALAALPVPRISFNYLGQFDQSLATDGPFRFASEDAGDPQPTTEPLVYPLDLNGMIVGGCLQFSIRYDPDVLSRQQIEALTQTFDGEVARLVEHCRRAAPRVSASDFPLARLSQLAFDALEVPSDDIEDVYPATPLQQGLIFHSLMKPSAYINRKRLTLHGALDIDAMRAAWQIVVARHAVLRTRFLRGHGDTMLQVVLKHVPTPFTVHDWRSRSDYDDAFAYWFEHEAPKRIDLDTASLMHVALFRRPDGAHDMAWINHHALSDGWSQAQLLGELTRAYVSARRSDSNGDSVGDSADDRDHDRGADGDIDDGLAARLEPVAPFRDYVAWLNEQPDAGDWWRAQLARADRPALLADSIPSSRRWASAATTGVTTAPGDAQTDTAPGHRTDIVSAHLSDAVKRAAQYHGVTLNTMIQAAWAIVLARYGNRRQAVFGVTVAGRPASLPGVSSMQGLFINSLPLWVDIPMDCPVGEWLRALQADNVAMRQAEHTPLSSIQQWAGEHFGPLFDSLLVFENYPVDPALTDGSLGLTVTMAETIEQTHYLLTLGVLPGNEIALEWRWDAQRLASRTVSQLAQAYLQVLEQLGDGQQRVAALRVDGRSGISGAAMAPDRRHAFQPVTARVDTIVQAQPDARAVRCGDISLSYGELNTLANRIARRLMAMGVGRDMPVGVCMERRPELIAALLGVMKAGGAYVPLDPTFPTDRLRGMMDDAGLRIVLTDASTAPRYDNAEPHGSWIDATACQCVRVDSMVQRDAEGDGLPNADAPIADQLAYVIYTSGSTGKPKGVAISHRALSLHLDDFIVENQLTADDCVLQFTTVNFDTSVEQIFASLSVGAAVEMRGPALWSTAELSRILVERRVSVADLPTGYWRQWIRELTAPLPGAVLRRVMVAGEALPGNAIAQWFAGPLAAIPFVNNYGPTETAITASAQLVAAEHAECVAAPIGRPRASRVYRLLDRDGLPTPDGGIGELCIGGEALARGYLGRPAQTAERFVPDPMGRPGARLYRTGDVCRWLPDGALAYGGRSDEQVKVRGYRIELGEIESVLCAQDGVAEAIAIVRGEQDAKRLFAYVVLSPQDPTTVDVDDASHVSGIPNTPGAPPAEAITTARIASLRGALARALPSYMVPSAIGVVDALPTLPNGKLDRHALPRLESDDHGAQGSEVDALSGEPLTPDERVLSEIWSDVLGVEPVGRQDDFFALGGHSLLALQVAARLQRALGREVPLRTLFDHPVLSSLASALTSPPVSPVASTPTSEVDTRHATALRVGPPLQRRGRREAPATHGQQRLWFLWRLAPDSAAYHLSLTVRIDGMLDASALHAALDDIVARHQMLHTRFIERDGQPWLVVDETLRCEWEATSSARGADKALHAWLQDSTERPFDLTNGPLLRARLARLDDGSHCFALAIHHIAADGWSMNILIDELTQAYDARRQGHRPIFDELPVQFTDYASWQHDTLDAGTADGQLAYWRARLGDDVPLLELPADRPRPPHRDGHGAQVNADVSASIATALHAFARRHDATLFMTLLAAFNALLYRYSGQQDLRIGIPMSGRDSVEIEPMIGFFVNTAVIRTELSGGLPFDALLEQVKQRVLEAQANQDVPFATIVDTVQPVRAANHTPLFQAMFNVDADTGKRARKADADAALQWQSIDGVRTAAQFDLTLAITLATPSAPDDAADLPGQRGRIGVSFSYATDIFERDTIERMLGDYVGILTQLSDATTVDTAKSAVTAGTPDRGIQRQAQPQGQGHRRAPRLHALSINARDVAQRGAALPVSSFLPVHARVSARAAMQPEAVALRDESQTITYRELDALSSQLARRLSRSWRGSAADPERRVGICVSRSPAMVVAVLAVMKAGAVYVPLDPSYPSAHLAGMIDDAGLVCTLVDAHGRAQLERIAARRGIDAVVDRHPFIDLDGDDRAEDRQSDRTDRLESVDPADRSHDMNEAAADVDATQLAYIIYTSGSTGKPKGVGVSHGALTRFLDSMHTRLPLTTQDVWLAVTTLSFDIAALELYLPLMCGATIALASREAVVDGRRLANLAERAGATVMQATPMGWRVLLDGGWRSDIAAGARNATTTPQPFVALCGGEALPPDLADALLLRGTQLWNVYGPTETTIWSSAARIDGSGTSITLGAPLEATTLLVIDAYGNAVPANGIGELCIGGANLARGYIGRPGLTAERFVPDASGEPGARVYRTGDMCRVRRDGAIDYLGRADQQTKLRGFRIELGETETALRAIDGIGDAVCQIQGEGTARRLVAFVTLSTESTLLTASSARRLPEDAGAAGVAGVAGVAGTADDAEGVAEGAATPRVVDIDLSDLRMQLQSRLPQQQVPTQIVALSTLPRTSNGKLNRTALPLVTTLPTGTADAYVAPQGAMQSLLCAVWAEVLGVERVGIRDDFFVLGGHSLAAVRVAGRLAEALGRKIALPLLLTHSRLEDLARMLDDTDIDDQREDAFDALQDLLDAL